MAFDSAQFQALTGYGTAVNIFSYTTSVDDLADVKVAGYFNEYINELTVGDLMFAQADDNYQQLRISSVTTNVEVEDYQSGPSAITGSDVANLGDASTVGGVPIIFTVETAGGVTADVDIIVANKIKVLDVYAINKANGTASDTIEVKNGANEISSVLDVSGVLNTLVRTTIIETADSTILAGGTLRVTETDGGGSDSPAVTVVINAVRVA